MRNTQKRSPLPENLQSKICQHIWIANHFAILPFCHFAILPGSQKYHPLCILICVITFGAFRKTTISAAFADATRLQNAIKKLSCCRAAKETSSIMHLKSLLRPTHTHTHTYWCGWQMGEWGLWGLRGGKVTGFWFLFSVFWLELMPGGKGQVYLRAENFSMAFCSRSWGIGTAK